MNEKLTELKIELAKNENTLYYLECSGEDPEYESLLRNIIHNLSLEIEELEG